MCIRKMYVWSCACLGMCIGKIGSWCRQNQSGAFMRAMALRSVVPCCCDRLTPKHQLVTGNPLGQFWYGLAMFDVNHCMFDVGREKRLAHVAVSLNVRANAAGSRPLFFHSQSQHLITSKSHPVEQHRKLSISVKQYHNSMINVAFSVLLPCEHTHHV